LNDDYILIKFIFDPLPHTELGIFKTTTIQGR